MTQDTTGQRRPANNGSEQIKETAEQLKERVQQQAGSVASQAQDQVKSRIATQKDSAAESLSGVAQALRQTGQQLRAQDQTGATGFLDEAASQVERLSGYLQGNDLNRLVTDVESFARRQPALFMGGAFLVGLLGARFIKSTRPTTYAQGSYDPTTGYRQPYGNQYPSGLSGYSSGTGGYTGGYSSGTGGYSGSRGSEFDTASSTGYGGAAPGVYDTPERTAGRQASTGDETRARAYGDRLEE